MQDRCTYRWAKSSGLNPEPISRPVNHSPMLLGHGPATVSLPQGKVLMACVRQSEDCSSSLRTSMWLDKSLPDLYYVWVQQRGDGGEMKAKLHQPWRTTDHKLWQKTGQKPSLWSGEDGTSCEWALGSFLLWGARTICLSTHMTSHLLKAGVPNVPFQFFIPHSGWRVKHDYVIWPVFL